eukprot:156422_1
MVAPWIILSVLISIQIAHGELLYWYTSSVRLPYNYKAGYHACGYAETSNQIYIFRTALPNKLISYNVDTEVINVSYPEYPILPWIRGQFAAEAYLEAPYWYFMSNDSFGQFHPHNHTITYPLPWKQNHAPMPTSVGLPSERACIVITNDGNYLIVLGGWDGSYLKTMQIYDIQRQTWKPNGPNMNRGRTVHGCVVDRNNFLYAIGGCCGSMTNPPERINITNIARNVFGTWTFIDPLSELKNTLRTVLYGDYIYVIGGYKGSTFGYTSDAVERIDIRTGVVTQHPSLPVPMEATCLTVANDKIYVIGGQNMQPYVDYWDTFLDSIIISNDLSGDPFVHPTTDPTFDPLTAPTIEPIVDPTHYPSMDPTYDPLTVPSIEPVVDPTAYPSVDPTYDPLAVSTMEPTNYPSMDPTFDPLAVPTIEPTDNPSGYPSIDPTFDPSPAPTIETTVISTNIIYNDNTAHREDKNIWNNVSVVIAIIICISVVVVVCVVMAGLVICQRNNIRKENHKLQMKFIAQQEEDQFEGGDVDREGIEMNKFASKETFLTNARSTLA